MAFPVWIAVWISCKYQAAPLECRWSLLGGWWDTLHCVLCLQPHQTIPNVIQIHSHRSAVLPAELLKFWCWQQGLISHSVLVWWLEPGYSLGLKLGQEFLGEGGEWVVSGGTQPRTDEQRSCQSLLRAGNHWVAWGMEHGMPQTGLGAASQWEGWECFTPALCLVLSVCKRRVRGSWVYALWAVSGWVQTCVYTDCGKALPLAERNLPVPWV